MRLPIHYSSPAEFVALVGVMRMLRVRARFGVGGFAEVEGDITAEDLLAHVRSRMHRIEDWPDDVSPAWIEGMHRQAYAALDRDLSDEACMLGSSRQPGRESPIEWVPTWFRMVSGRQRWIEDMRRAMRQIDASTIARWLRQYMWPRDYRMGMTGVDEQAYTPPALRWAGSDTSAGSMGNPVSLWLMWEGYHAFPCLAGVTAGWAYAGSRKSPSHRRFRWPVWREYASWETIRGAYSMGATSGIVVEKHRRELRACLSVELVMEAFPTRMPPGSKYWRLARTRACDESLEAAAMQEMGVEQ